MLTLTWHLEETGDCGDTVRFDRVMLGGTTRKGDPMPLFRLCELVEATGVEWICKACGGAATGFNKEKGTYKCPECGEVASMEFDTDDLLMATAKVKVSLQKKEGDDREFPQIDHYYAL
jgi:hypothetical protein